jgi:flagellar motor switch protein FliN/FliY
MSDALSQEQLRAIEESGQLALGSGATTLSILLNKQVSITSPKTSVIAANELATAVKEPLVLIDVAAEVADVPVMLGFILTQQDTSVITDLMMGGEGNPPSAIIDDLQLSAISEAINQMLGMASNTLNTTYGKRLEFQPPQATVIDNPEEAALPPAYLAGELVLITYTMMIDGLPQSVFIQVLPADSASSLATAFLAPVQKEKSVAAAPPTQDAPPPTPPHTQPAPQADMPPPQYAPPPQPAYAPPPPGYAQPAAYAPPAYMPPPQHQAPPVNAQPAQFSPLAYGQAMTAPNGLELVLDVPLKVTVELGRTRMQIRDVLDLGKGSVVELDKLAGEPVDLLVNGKLIARGEVVVIDENFGIRVTDIVSPAERFSSFRG